MISTAKEFWLAVLAEMIGMTGWERAEAERAIGDVTEMQRDGMTAREATTELLLEMGYAT